MELYGVGNVLLHYREKNEFLQIQVCEGICTEITLSRIEAGEREFDALISETLLSRLGKSTNRFEFVLNEEDYDYYILREKIEKTVGAFDTETAKLHIAEYRENSSFPHKLHEQFLLFYEAMIMKIEGKPKHDVVEQLYKAINLTRPDFLESETYFRLYSRLEIKIIYELLLYESFSYESLSGLLQFIDKMYDEEEKGIILIPFLYHYAQQYRQEEKWHKLEDITSRGIAYLQAGRTYAHLVEFQYMNLLAEYELHKNTAEWDAKRIELIHRCNAIYYMSMTIENFEIMKKAECFCKEQLGCQITM